MRERGLLSRLGPICQVIWLTVISALSAATPAILVAQPPKGERCSCQIPADPFFNDRPLFVPVDLRRTSVQRGLDWLYHTQVTPEQELTLNGRDWSGNWPQYLSPELLPTLRIRDISPFVVSFVHHSLALANEQTADVLQLTASDVQSTRLMRQRAIAFMVRFRSESPLPDAGAVRFWPRFDDSARLEQCPMLAWLIQIVFGGDFFYGDCAPINLWTFPPGYLIPADADTTANIYEALLTDQELDGGTQATFNPVPLFENWRDLGQEPMRVRFPWMPNPSRGFLTWLAERDPQQPRTPQDVDLLVNANVLFCLGRYNRLDADGVSEAATLINDAVSSGRYRDISQISSYYPDSLVFHYVVSRAFYEGGVSELASAVQTVADELEVEARIQSDGTVVWDRGNPSLNTAFAVVTLLNAGRNGRLTDGGARYLRQSQHPKYGYWPEAPFFQGTSAEGYTTLWASSALTTAMALEALMRVQLLSSQPNVEKPTESVKARTVGPSLSGGKSRFQRDSLPSSPVRDRSLKRAASGVAAN